MGFYYFGFSWIAYCSNTTDISNSSGVKTKSESIQQIDTETGEQQQIQHFIAKQLTLVFAAPKGRRYSTDRMIPCISLGTINQLRVITLSNVT